MEEDLGFIFVFVSDSGVPSGATPVVVVVTLWRVCVGWLWCWLFGWLWWWTADKPAHLTIRVLWVLVSDVSWIGVQQCCLVNFGSGGDSGGDCLGDCLGDSGSDCCSVGGNPRVSRHHLPSHLQLTAFSSSSPSSLLLALTGALMWRWSIIVY